MPRLYFLVVCLVTLSAGAQPRTLYSYLDIAKRNSPAIREYQAQILALGLDSQLLKATLRPQVNFLSNDSYAPVIKGWGYDEAITNIANVSGLIQASRNFITKGNLAAQLRTIALQRQSLLDTITLSGQDLYRNIADQYILAYSDLLATDYNLEVFELMQREEEALKKLTQQSVYKQTDYLAFYVTMQQQELSYLQSRITYNNDFLTLNYLAGIADTTIYRIDKPQLPDTVANDYYTSVFYQRFVTDSLRLRNEKELIRYEYKPRIGAYADGGYNSSLQVMPYRNFGVSAGVSIVVPLYDGKQRQLKEAKLDIQERTRLYNRDYYINQYRIQLVQLKQQLVAIDQVVTSINKQINYAHTLITANGKLLQTGDITMKDYVLAINNYLAAKNLLTQNEINRLKILSQIGYWNMRP